MGINMLLSARLQPFHSQIGSGEGLFLATFIASLPPPRRRWIKLKARPGGAPLAIRGAVGVFLIGPKTARVGGVDARRRIVSPGERVASDARAPRSIAR